MFNLKLHMKIHYHRRMQCIAWARNHET